MKLKFRKLKSPKALREERVQSLLSELSQAKALVLFTSTAVTHLQFEELRVKLEPFNAKVRFVKNTLFRVAAKEAGLPEGLYADQVLFEQTGLILLNDEDVVEPLKTFVTLFKDAEGVKAKIAWIDGAVEEGQKVKIFASLPSRPQLHARLVASLAAPLYRLHRACTYDMQKLVVALEQISSKQA